MTFLVPFHIIEKRKSFSKIRRIQLFYRTSAYAEHMIWTREFLTTRNGIAISERIPGLNYLDAVFKD